VVPGTGRGKERLLFQKPLEKNMNGRDGDVPRSADAPASDVAADQSTTKVGDAAHRVKEAASSTIADVKSAAMQHVDGAREKAGEMGHTTAMRFRDIAGQVETDMPWLSGAFTRSADGLDSMTDSLTRGDMGQMLNDLTDFAKRQPAIFLGVSVALGFALARIGKTAMEGPSTEAEVGIAEAEAGGDAYTPQAGA
jgi:hypothetical protein